VAFVASRIGLDELSPPVLVAARFLVAAAAVVLVPRPRASWLAMTAVGLTLFAGQFLFQFFGIAAGMPPGLASIVVQTQAIFTIVLAALVLGERPGARHVVGVALGVAGLGTIALTVGGDLTVRGFLLTCVSAVSFAVGNLLWKRLPPAAPLALVAWLSLVPPVPALLVAATVDAAPPATLSWRGIVAAL
jgi:O-acetylserine/cysteine efflux transporter